MAVDLKVMESHLSQFKGGGIRISKEYWDEGIALIKLDHQEKRNAISGKMMVDLRDCLSELERWKEGKSAILMGEGSNFCSGGDLDFARATGTASEGDTMSYWMQRLLIKFLQLPLLKVSLVHGAALGGGAELALFSDYVLMAEDARIGFVHGKMGLTTAWGGATRLVRLVGERTARQCLLSGVVYTAEECLKMSLASEILGAETRLTGALDFVRGLTRFDHSITRSYQKVIQAGANETLEESLRVERAEFSSKWGSEMNAEALERKLREMRENR